MGGHHEEGSADLIHVIRGDQEGALLYEGNGGTNRSDVLRSSADPYDPLHWTEESEVSIGPKHSVGIGIFGVVDLGSMWVKYSIHGVFGDGMISCSKPRTHLP